MFKADLHCHSTFSDGSLEPEALLDLAFEKGLSALSITDHDTVSAYPRAIVKASSLGFPLLYGAEFSAQHKNESIHILAYAFPIDSPVILALCQRQKEIRHERNLQIVANLRRKFNIVIDYREQESGSTGRVHIARELVRNGIVQTEREAFAKYIGDGKPAYVLGDKLAVSDVIDQIHKASGLALLAHPHCIKKRRILKALFEMNFDGFEAYYAKMTLVNEKSLLEMARAKLWILTGGSDFHGPHHRYLDLGCSYTPKESFDRLYKHQKSHVGGQ